MFHVRNKIDRKNIKRKKVNTREGCQAHIILQLTEDGKFKVIRFHKCHVHPLCTSSRRLFLSSNKNISSIHKDMTYIYAIANVGQSDVYHLMKEQVGGD